MNLKSIKTEIRLIVLNGGHSTIFVDLIEQVWEIVLKFMAIFVKPVLQTCTRISNSV